MSVLFSVLGILGWLISAALAVGMAVALVAAAFVDTRTFLIVLGLAVVMATPLGMSASYLWLTRP